MTKEELAVAPLDVLAILAPNSYTAIDELVRRAESIAAVARAAYILGAKAAHEDTVEGRYNCDPGYDWDCDPRIFEDALDNAGGST